jgi:hypothetical protein
MFTLSTVRMNKMKNLNKAAQKKVTGGSQLWRKTS